MVFESIEIVRDLNEKITIDSKLARDYEAERESMYNKLYLGEIVDIEKPSFGKNNLILAPVGSGKSHLIEKNLIPKNYDKKILYLTSSTALKDSICPPGNAERKQKADNGESLRYFTSQNKERFGDPNYNVHVMTYHEFGIHLDIPASRRKLLEDVGLVFCDEIHSLPIYENYGGANSLTLVRSWLFEVHENIDIYYFTATEESIKSLNEDKPGTLDYVDVFNYLKHPQIRKYVFNSKVLVNHIEQIRPHLKSKKEAFDYYGYKALAFTSKITEQKKIAKIAEDEGFNPIILWSTNNSDEEMSDEQLKVRTFLLQTGLIPEPYNLLIINGAMQEGWNLNDNMMRLAILDTLDVTEQVQALGRIRRDIDLLICKTDEKINDSVNLPDEYLNIPLDTSKKTELYSRLNILNKRGNICKWPTIKNMLQEEGYTIEDKKITIDGKRKAVSVIKPIMLNQ